MMRIGIDVRYLSHGLVGGVHTYIKHFVPALIELAPEHQIYLYADTKRPFELKALPEHVTVRYFPWKNPASSVGNDFLMWQQMERDKLDVAHFPANYGFGPRQARIVITLHDAINILPMPEIIRGHPKNPRTIAMMTYLHVCSKAALRRADLLITASEHARREIAAVGRIDLQKIVAVHHAPTPDMGRVTEPARLDAVRHSYELSRPFVLADGLKNPVVLVRAWRRLPAALRASRQIVFFARRPDVLPIVHEAVKEGHARLLVRPSRADLIALYSMAEAFVFPSWIEGFGIPVLEAMICGAPVIAADNSAIPEVAGGAALLANAEDDATIAQHITRVLTDPAAALRFRELGYARAAQFSWRSAAQRILDCYYQAMQFHPSDDSTGTQAARSHEPSRSDKITTPLAGAVK
ncbi:MAG: glycosyltransferase family 4 protein [Chloroflexales bacterium]|nr:glycosyltransferase family 4 protein [Chloroflexales bacterium]